MTRYRCPDCGHEQELNEADPSATRGCPMAAEWQLRVHIICLDCGRGADDEFCIGPFFATYVLETDPEEFQPCGAGKLADYEGPSHVPMVFDAEGNNLPDHPIMLALRGNLDDSNKRAV